MYLVESITTKKRFQLNNSQWNLSKYFSESFSIHVEYIVMNEKEKTTCPLRRFLQWSIFYSSGHSTGCVCMSIEAYCNSFFAFIWLENMREEETKMFTYSLRQRRRKRTTEIYCKDGVHRRNPVVSDTIENCLHQFSLSKERWSIDWSSAFFSFRILTERNESRALDRLMIIFQGIWKRKVLKIPDDSTTDNSSTN